MRTSLIIITVCLAAALVSGCWDQQLLKDARIAYIVGFDLSSDGKLQTTSSVLDVSGEQTGNRKYSEIHTAIGNTSRHTRDIIDREISGRFTAAKLRVILIGEALAKQGIYPFLDVFYRDPRSALNAKIAVIGGKTSDYISKKISGSKLIGEHYTRLIQSAEGRTIAPVVDLQLIRPKIKDPGDDFAVPYISNDVTHPAINGIALFNGDHMVGTLQSEDSLLYLLMADKLNKSGSLTLKVNGGGQSNPEQYLAMEIQSIKRKMKVNVQSNQDISVALDLHLKVTAIEYAKDHLEDKQNVQQLDKILSEELTRSAQAITRNMQQVNHDGFGIGRRMMAYHPDTWSKLNWTEDYQKVTFNPKVSVEIVNHGITY
ncbi:Ger(x)C family spore germination protein [Paenibacillus marinisediminis]